LLHAKCSLCHGATTATKGLSFATYADALRGGQDGPVIVAGDVAGSKLIQIQSAGGHPGQLTADELTLIKNWITARAPEK
jgi:mono/diheme cytochrome c family protein